MLWLCILLPRFAPEASAGGRPQAERAALEVLALWALQWSSQVSIEPAGSAGRGSALWIEIGASSQLFGGHAALRERIAADLASLGYTHRLGAAPTPGGASLLARAGLATVATTRTQLRQLLAPLPLTLLALPEEPLAALQDAGLQCIGELLVLGAAAIAQRFGPGASLYLQRLCGEVREPLRMVRAPQRFTSRCEFADPVTDTTALLFPLQRLLAGLQGFLRSRDRAVQRYTLCLEHHRRAATRLEIGLARPGRDAAQLLALARERLAASTLGAAVHGLGLEAHELLQPLVLQNDLFSRAAQHSEQLQQVIDRLAARLGESAVQTLRGAADHRPERAWRMSAASVTASAAAPVGPAVPVRPCWLLPQPLHIDRPQELFAGPERIESGWWDGADVARDYYLARGADGAQLWVFHDLRNGAWCVHGLWA
ncbi:MAG TPA: DNA polymerase Y family protein [Steroidobacteraceae bacterium]|nr:DNA polymerase Y family protein [Steroidobacteraceae bacterium]